MEKQLFLTLSISLFSLPLIGMDSSAAAAATASTFPASTSTTTSASAATTTVLSGAPTTFVNPVVFTTADEKEITVEKDVAELCETIKNSPDLGNSAEKIPLPNIKKADIEKLLVVLQILGNSTLNKTQKVHDVNTALNGYTTQDLIITLSVADYLLVLPSIFRFLFEYTTQRMSNFTDLDYLSNESVSNILQNDTLRQLILEKFSQEIPEFFYWIMKFSRQSINYRGMKYFNTRKFTVNSDDGRIIIAPPHDEVEFSCLVDTTIINTLSIKQALFLIHIYKHYIHINKPVAISEIPQQLLISSYDLPDKFVNLLPEDLKIQINMIKTTELD